MNQEDIIQFLKQNLKINITTKAHNDYYKGVTGYDIEVSIFLNEDIITKSTDCIDIK